MKECVTMKTKIVALLCTLIIFAGLPISVSAEGSGAANIPSEPINTPVSLEKCKIDLSTTKYTYLANEKRPKVTVTYNGIIYKKGKHYTVDYKDNINAGKAKVIITAVEGNDSLSGTVTKTFSIERKELSSFSNKVISNTDYIYSGSEKKPNISFSNDYFKAVLGKDYTLTYKNNIKVGIATVVAKGIGNCKGTYTKSFYIRPTKVKNLKVTSLSDKTFKLSWSKVSGGIDGYRIYRYNSSKKDYDFAVSTSSSYFNVGGREPATSYTYMVKAYKKVGGKLVLGDSSSGKKVTMKPAKVTVNPSAYKGKYFTFKWNKVKASGYQIQYSKNKNLKKPKTVTVRSSSAASKKVKLSSKTNYYYRIRAYKKADGKTLYGAWSDKKTTQFSNVYSSYSTYFNSPAGRTTNIKLACKKIDGTVLKPGDTFSFNNVVGQRTPQRGFKKATVYSGQEVTTGYGGGVCQVSTTIFNAVLRGNLSITERHQHSMKVHYVNSGYDAAISWGSADFKFKNSTSQDIKISAKVYNNSKLEIKLLTNSSAKPPKVKLSVSNSGKQYTLKRSVDGKVNYTTYSYY